MQQRVYQLIFVMVLTFRNRLFRRDAGMPRLGEDSGVSSDVRYGVDIPESLVLKNVKLPLSPALPADCPPSIVQRSEPRK